MPPAITAEPLELLAFESRFVNDLPADPETTNRRRHVPGACYSLVEPTPVAAPKLLAYSPDSAALLDLDEDACRSPLFTEVFSGNRLLPGMRPYAMCYGGHQFGSWAGQLGDGRAINLGELINQRRERWVLQLKGAGPTPYSRSADGLAVLRSSLREFVCSEAMHHLGIPSTRALSLIVTGEQVLRDMFYDGRPRREPGAVVCRLAPSFLRFGNFELLTARGEIDLLRRLVDHTITTDFSELSLSPGRDGYLRWFAEVGERTVNLVTHWMRVGFVHGVLNTDNMSILGLTIDYGPYGWLEGYDPVWTPNTTDAQGRRYCYNNQPQVAMWNLAQLANALVPLIGTAEPLQAAVDSAHRMFQENWRHTLAAKFGLTDRRQGDATLLQRAFDLMSTHEIDLTIFFRRLSQVTANTDTPDDFVDFFSAALYRHAELREADRRKMNDWLADYRARLTSSRTDDVQRRRSMNRVNPKFVFRNYLAQQAIDQAEQGDASMIETLLEVLRHPYDDQPGKEHFARRRPEWARDRPGCSMLSCSS